MAEGEELNFTEYDNLILDEMIALLKKFNEKMEKSMKRDQSRFNRQYAQDTIRFDRLDEVIAKLAKSVTSLEKNMDQLCQQVSANGKDSSKEVAQTMNLNSYFEYPKNQKETLVQEALAGVDSQDKQKSLLLFQEVDDKGNTIEVSEHFFPAIPLLPTIIILPSFKVSNGSIIRDREKKNQIISAIGSKSQDDPQNGDILCAQTDSFKNQANFKFNVSHRSLLYDIIRTINTATHFQSLAESNYGSRSPFRMKEIDGIDCLTKKDGEHDVIIFDPGGEIALGDITETGPQQQSLTTPPLPPEPLSFSHHTMVCVKLKHANSGQNVPARTTQRGRSYRAAYWGFSESISSVGDPSDLEFIHPRPSNHCDKSQLMYVIRDERINVVGQMFDEMLEKDVISRSTIVKGHVRNGPLDIELQYFKEMREISIKSNKIILTIVLSTSA